MNKRTRVLVAEDNRLNVELLINILEYYGVDYTHVETGECALKAFEQARFDLVVMDRHLPGISGLEATESIRALEQNEGRERTPIIALTASAIAGDRQICLAAGMDDYVSKPFKMDSIRQMIDKWVNLVD